MGIKIAILTLNFLVFAVCHVNSHPRPILVGGYVGSWKVPDSPNNTLNQWAEKTRFKVGDILVWKYDMKIDSVLQVTKEDYKNCNLSNPLRKYDEEDTKVTLDKSGPYFFISGAPGNCEKGEKLTIIVLSERKSNDSSPTNSPSVNPPATAPTATHSAAVGVVVGHGLFWSALVIGLQAILV